MAASNACASFPLRQARAAARAERTLSPGSEARSTARQAAATVAGNGSIMRLSSILATGGNRFMIRKPDIGREGPGRPGGQIMTDLDVAIIGGGCAGTYSAWRLQQEMGDKSSIGLFEYSDRIGGRLYSVTVPGVPSLKAELGGMRYIEESHRMVAQLVEHLKLA